MILFAVKKLEKNHLFHKWRFEKTKKKLSSLRIEHMTYHTKLRPEPRSYWNTSKSKINIKISFTNTF